MSNTSAAEDHLYYLLHVLILLKAIKPSTGATAYNGGYNPYSY